LICERREGTRREIQGGFVTPGTPVGNGNGNRFTLVGGGDLPAADGVGVRIYPIVTRVNIEQVFGHGTDEISVHIGDATRSETSCVESPLSAVSAR